MPIPDMGGPRHGKSLPGRMEQHSRQVIVDFGLPLEVLVVLFEVHRICPSGNRLDVRETLIGTRSDATDSRMSNHLA